LEPCFHVEGKPGYALKTIERHNNGPFVNVANPVPQEFDFLFSTKLKWEGCVTSTAYEGSYTTSDHYDTKLKPSEGLTLDIYAAVRCTTSGIFLWILRRSTDCMPIIASNTLYF